MSLVLNSSLWGKPQEVIVNENLAHFAALTYGDGYPEWGELRVVTYNNEFKDKLAVLAAKISREFDITWRVYSRPGTITINTQHNIVLNSTLIRRAFFYDNMRPNYDSIYSMAMHDELAPHFQAGLSDAEGSLLLPVPIESPHGRIFAILNDDRRLLGISRLALIYKLRLEPTSVRIRLASKKGRQHETHGQGPFYA